MSGPNRIATHSLGEGLDFACNLLTSAVDGETRLRPERASILLRELTYYISVRYAGEDGLAFESLNDLAKEIGPDVEYPREQFRAQVQWCADTIENRRRSGS